MKTIKLKDKIINLIFFKRVPSIQIDQSDTIRVTFMTNKECDIVTSKSSGLNVTYALNESGDIEVCLLIF